MQWLLHLYRWLIARKAGYRLNLHLYKLSLRGIGVLNSEGSWATGETAFFEWLKDNQLSPQVIIDAGANTGHISLELLEIFPTAQIWAFEPHPKTFEQLEKNVQGHKNIHAIQAGLGDKTQTTTLWDFAKSAPLKSTQPTSTLSSLHKPIITQHYGQPAQGYQVNITTLDKVAQQHQLTQIDLLKIDTEGHELSVLKGANQLLKNGKIKVIQFEFNELHAYSKVFMKDFVELLNDFDFYRLLPDGPVALGPYRPITHEIFGFQNIVAIKRNK
ncbi:MAG: FkbM family methyltransferase [Patescibacteria group bacterium]